MLLDKHELNDDNDDEILQGNVLWITCWFVSKRDRNKGKDRKDG